MEIKSISHNPYYNKDLQKTANNEVKTEAGKKDKIEISPEALSLQQSKSTDSKKLEEIKEKISNGFYNKDEVVEKVATELLKDISGQK